jgi:rhamnulokinase/L-fuculokinase
MDKSTTVLAFDLGASSGRAVKGTFSDGKLTCGEIHRFVNTPVEKGGSLCWDIGMLMEEIHKGIDKAGEFYSVSFDTWGVDFGLLDSSGRLIGLPVHYRDPRTRGMTELAARVMPPEELYARTGSQIMEHNTLFQLMAIRMRSPQTLAQAHTLLFMPDLLSYLLCGSICCERTIASTSQMLDPRTGKWRGDILKAFDLPDKLLPGCITPTGTVAGKYRGRIVTAGAGHDTQCAIAAMPEGEDAAFLSCGTWSLIGTQLDAPVLTAESCRLGLSNETDAQGNTDYLKNIIGLWLIQESRREWKRRGRDYSFGELDELALASQPLRCFIDPDAPEFVAPGDIPGRISEYCRRTGQYVPQSVGEITRCIYESLALKYRFALGQLEHATGRHFARLNILGGGSRDPMLCRMTASSCGIPVSAGPAEATALGNIIIQLHTLGAIPSLSMGRRLIEASFPAESYLPGDCGEWDAAFCRYTAVTGC